jgi:hypothetical protein
MNKIKPEHAHLSNQEILKIYGVEIASRPRPVIRTIPNEFYPALTMEGVKYLQEERDRQNALGKRTKIRIPKEFIIPTYKIRDIKAYQNATND